MRRVQSVCQVLGFEDELENARNVTVQLLILPLRHERLSEPNYNRELQSAGLPLSPNLLAPALAVHKSSQLTGELTRVVFTLP